MDLSCQLKVPATVGRRETTRVLAEAADLIAWFMFLPAAKFDEYRILDDLPFLECVQLLVKELDLSGEASPGSILR